MKKTINGFETLELTNESITANSIKFPSDLGNIKGRKIKSIVAYSSTEMPFSPNKQPLIDASFFKSAFIKLSTKGKVAKMTNLPLQMLNPTQNNGCVYDIDFEDLDTQNSEIVLGQNNVSQLNKVFYLGFILE